MRLVLAVLMLTGCGRLGFDVSSPDDAAALDGPPGDAGLLCGIPIAEAVISPPAPLADIAALLQAIAANPGRSEFDPVWSEDGLTLYFTSDQTLQFVVYRATRPALDAPFDAVEELPGDVNAAANLHFGFQPLASLGIAMISAPYGGAASLDFWRGTRTGTTWTWQPTSLSTPDSDNDARMTADGRTLYFARGPADATRDIYRAVRPAITDDFGPPEIVTALSSPASDSGPWPARDGMFVVSDRGASTGEDIWYAPAATGVPVRLDAVSGADFDGEPTLLESTCELVLVSNRGGAFDLYRATITRR